MKCPCSAKLLCLETRERKGYVHRRYKCPKCEKRFTTSEVLDVLKNDKHELRHRITTVGQLLEQALSIVRVHSDLTQASGANEKRAEDQYLIEPDTRVRFPSPAPEKP